MPRYYATSDIQERYRISRSSIYRWQANPEIRFPEPMKIGHRILWREEDLNAFDARFFPTDAQAEH